MKSAQGIGSYLAVTGCNALCSLAKTLVLYPSLQLLSKFNDLIVRKAVHFPVAVCADWQYLHPFT
jgi:hypothetical protein